MIEIDRKNYRFKTKEIWFSDYPYDISGYDRVVFRDCKNKVDNNGFIRSEFSTLIIDLTKDLDEILKNMNQASCRRYINRAIRENITIKINQNYDEFEKIYRSFREEKELGGGESIEILKKYGTLFVANYEGKVLGGVFYLENNNIIRGWYTATKRLEANKETQKIIGDANRLLHWEAIKYSKSKGIKVFDWGGYYIGKKKDPEKERINNFKKTFGGELVYRYNYEKYYSRICKLAFKTYNMTQQFFIF
jgi:lipid II:glycine glycyltransferase (peptidoglycan interpeptide bridge formation enzyme)